MENFNLDNFDPTTAQLQAIVETYRGLSISKDGIEKVKEAKRDLQKKRVYIQKTLKLDRDKAIQYQKMNISKEKELVAIIQPIEKSLDEQIEAMLMEEEMEKRRETLEIRWEELKNIGMDKEYDESFVLSMNFPEFMDFIRNQKAMLFEQEQEKKREKEAEEKRLADLAEAEERGKKKAEEELIENNRLAQEAKERKEKLDKEKLEADEKYNAWLSISGYNEDDFMITDNGNEKIMRKKVSVFKSF